MSIGTRLKDLSEVNEVGEDTMTVLWKLHKGECKMVLRDWSQK